MSIAAPVSGLDPLQQLISSDPSFDADHFLEFAEMAFFLVKKAIQERDSAGARAFVNDSVYNQLAAQAASERSMRRVPIYDGLWIKGLRLSSCAQEQGWTYLYVVFHANAARYWVNETSGQPLPGDTEIGDFDETWTFARVAGAVSKVGGGVMEYKCPSCSAPLSLNDLGTCQHCGAPVASGQLDWVVAAFA